MVIEHPPSVTLVVADGDEIVLVRQRRAGADGDVLELPAGKLDPGEDVRAAADRELAEECGLAVAEWRELGSFWAAPAYSTERVTVLAGVVSGIAEAEQDPDEEIEVVRKPKESVPGSLEDGISIAAFALYLRESA